VFKIATVASEILEKMKELEFGVEQANESGNPLICFSLS